jgi:transcriptional regulator with XRE-family HTH domain
VVNFLVEFFFGTLYTAGMGTKDKELARKFGLLLRDLRATAGLTQAQFGAKVGMHVQAVSRYEKGERAPTLALLYKLAKAIGCKPCDLLPAGAELPAPPPAKPRGRRA